MSIDLNSSSITDIVLDDDDSLLENLLEACAKNSDAIVTETVVLNKDGYHRKVNRTDYSRLPKRQKHTDAWNTPSLQEIQQVSVDNPLTREGEYFRKRFRVPFPIFKKIVQMCRDTEEHAFNYLDTNCAGEPSIPLELKVLTALRILASGSKFQEAIEMNGFQSYSSANDFFKDVLSFV